MCCTASVFSIAVALLFEPVNHVTDNDDAVRYHSTCRSRGAVEGQCSSAFIASTVAKCRNLNGLQRHALRLDSTPGVIDFSRYGHEHAALKHGGKKWYQSALEYWHFAQ